MTTRRPSMCSPIWATYRCAASGAEPGKAPGRHRVARRPGDDGGARQDRPSSRRYFAPRRQSQPERSALTGSPGAAIWKPAMLDLDHARRRMVDAHIARRGVRDERVLEAMRTVHREDFVEPGFEEFAYEDAPL